MKNNLATAVCRCLMKTKLIGEIINNLRRGKAAGLDSLTAERLQFSHSILFIRRS